MTMTSQEIMDEIKRIAESSYNDNEQFAKDLTNFRNRAASSGGFVLAQPIVGEARIIYQEQASRFWSECSEEEYFRLDQLYNNVGRPF